MTDEVAKALVRIRWQTGGEMTRPEWGTMTEAHRNLWRAHARDVIATYERVRLQP